MPQDEARSVVRFERITARTVREICHLSETLTEQQRTMVTDNAVSIAQAHFSKQAWFRAIYAGDTPVGFVMLHFGSDFADGIDCAGAFLWRFMIAGPHQGKGYGREAMALIIEHLQAQGFSELYTSYALGEGSPEDFYQGLGFVPTGGRYGEQIEAVYRFASGGGPRASCEDTRAAVSSAEGETSQPGKERPASWISSA